MPAVDDFYLDGMIHGFVATASHPGEVSGLSLPLLPKGYGVLTASDIPGNNSFVVSAVEMPILASHSVAYTGQPTALIYGPDPDVLSEIAEKCEVRYKSGVNEIHVPASLPVINRISGRPVAAFKGAYQIVESRYSVAPETVPTGGHRGAIASAVAYWENGLLTVATPSSWPYHARDAVASALDTSPKNVRVRTTESAAPLDMRLWIPSLSSVYAAIIATVTAAPVKMLSENLIPMHHKETSFAEVVYRTALKENGDLSAVDITVQLDVGAYPILAREGLERFCLGVLGTYKCKHIRLSGGVTLTDNLPGRLSSLNALGKGFSVAEVNASRVAEVSQRGVLEWRTANRLTSLQFEAQEKQDAEAILERLSGEVEHLADFTRKHASYEMQKKRREPERPPSDDGDQRIEAAGDAEGAATGEELGGEIQSPRRPILVSADLPRRGIGFASAFQVSGFLHPIQQDPSSIVVKMDTEGEVEIRSTATYSPHAKTAWRSIVSEIMGVDPNAISFSVNDTAVAGDSGPGVFSKNITVNRKLIEQCCRAIQKKRFRSPLPLEVKRGSRSVRAEFPQIKHPVAFGAAAVETGIDPVTFTPIIRGVWLAIDAGTVIHKEGAIHRLETETYQIVKQMVGNISSEDKQLPVTCVLVEGQKRSPAGVDGLVSSLIPAAMSAAVAQALGYYYDDIPLTSQSVFRTWRADDG